MARPKPPIDIVLYIVMMLVIIIALGFAVKDLSG